MAREYSSHLKKRKYMNSRDVKEKSEGGRGKKRKGIIRTGPSRVVVSLGRQFCWAVGVKYHCYLRGTSVLDPNSSSTFVRNDARRARAV